MEITIKIDSERLTFGDLLALEDAQDGKRPFHSMGQVICKFIVDSSGEYIPFEKATELLQPLTLNQVTELVGQFGEAVKDVQKSAVPPTKGGS